MAVTKTIQDQVTELYVGFFGRAPDAAGMGYWAEKLGAGTATVYSIANEFSKTPEFVSNYGALTPSEQIDKIYVNVLDRKADDAGKAYWLSELTKGTPIGNVVYNIVNAAFSQSGTADGLLVQNKVAVGEYFSLVLASNDTAVAKTAYTGVTSVASSVTAKEAELAQAVAPTYTLTTSIETVPASGTLPLYANVTGVVATAGSTFQTGDTINGTVDGKNVLTITDASTVAGNVVATVKNVAEVKHNLLGNNTYDESLYTGVVEEYATNAAAGSTLTLINGQLTTTYGIKDATAASTLNVGIRAADTTGTANTLKLSVRNAGSTIVQTGVAPVSNVATINATSTGIEAIAILTSGVNNIAITDTPAAGVATDYAKLTVTGDGANTINVAALTQTLSYDLSGATGANTLNFAGALQSNTAIVGGTAADTVRVDQGAIVAGISLTGVETLRSTAAASTGTVAFTTSSLETVRIDGRAAADAASVLSLIAPGSVKTVNYIGDGLAVNVATAGGEQFKSLTMTGAFTGTADTLALNLSNAGTTQLAGYTVGALTANGVETINVTVTEAAATATATFNGITSNTLQSVKFTSPATITATVNGTPAAGNSALTSVDLSGVTGSVISQLTLANGSVGAATQVVGSTGTGGTALITDVQVAGDVLLFTGGQGNDTIVASNGTYALATNTGTAGAASFAGILQASMGAGTNNVLVGGTGAGGVPNASTSVITLSGTGSVNTITGNAGNDTITVNATGLGSTNNVNTGNGTNSVNASASTVTVTLTGGTGTDTLIGGAAADTINSGADAAVTGIGDTITGGNAADTINLQHTAATAMAYTVNATAAQSFATAGQFDTVNNAVITATGTNVITLVSGVNAPSIQYAAAVVIGTTAVANANAVLVVGAANPLTGARTGSFSVYQDSNGNSVIDATDLRVDFNPGDASDTIAIALVGQQTVVTVTGV